jgi:hypothetical protein
LRRACVLRLLAEQAESLWDDALPVEVRELPEDLPALDRLLSDSELLEPIAARFREERAAGRSVIADDGWIESETSATSVRYPWMGGRRSRSRRMCG